VNGTSLQRTLSARPLGAAALRVLVLAAALSTAPVLAPAARAQRSGAVQASAYVVSSYLGAGLRQDTAAAPRVPSARPVALRLHIDGLGSVEVETGRGAEVPYVSRAVKRAGRTTVTVLISYVNS